MCDRNADWAKLVVCKADPKSTGAKNPQARLTRSTCDRKQRRQAQLLARAFGAARSGNPEAAKADIAKLAELSDKLREAKDSYWSQIVDIQRQVAAAWVLYAEGKYDQALNAIDPLLPRKTLLRMSPSRIT